MFRITNSARITLNVISLIIIIIIMLTVKKKKKLYIHVYINGKIPEEKIKTKRKSVVRQNLLFGRGKKPKQNNSLHDCAPVITGRDDIAIQILNGGVQ